jgi:regulator of protease activity HflC (stomatin/prohibitin superfamily)
MVDIRVLAADIPRQEVITKDNVPVSINGALFFKVMSVEDAVMKIRITGSAFPCSHKRHCVM